MCVGFLLVNATTSSAQKKIEKDTTVTTQKLIRALLCSDTTCYNSFFLKNNYIQQGDYNKTPNNYFQKKYIVPTQNCNNSDNIIVVVADVNAFVTSLLFMTTCKNNFDEIVEGFPGSGVEKASPQNFTTDVYYNYYYVYNKPNLLIQIPKSQQINNNQLYTIQFSKSKDAIRR